MIRFRTSALVRQLRYYHTRQCFGHKIKRYEEYQASIPLQNSDLSLSRLVAAYRDQGHLKACLDPLCMKNGSTDLLEHILNPRIFGLAEDGGQVFEVDGVLHGFPEPRGSLPEVLDYLEGMYCSTMSLQATYISNVAEREWLLKHYEQNRHNAVTKDSKLRLAKLLTHSQTFDHFMARRFGTVKRYGAEGAESMLAFFYQVLTDCVAMEIEEVVMGMPHRGRLNLLTDLLQFPNELFFHKLLGNAEYATGAPSTGDVLSHLTSSVDVVKGDYTVHVTMLPNPSHLEAVCPVAMGKVRARLLTRRDDPYNNGLLDRYTSSSSSSSSVTQPPSKVLCLQVHGDAAMCAQGIVAESLCLATSPFFDVGGSVHLVVNNQLGFTAELDRKPYGDCSDIMHSIAAPIIHVNGADPEEVVRATAIAMGYWQRFQKDILIDLVCYRKWGHNELDNPSLTQPLMYDIINKETSVPDRYALELEREGLLDKQALTDMTEKYWTSLGDSMEASKTHTPAKTHLLGRWQDMGNAPPVHTMWDTGCPVDLLKFVGAASVQVPDSVVVHEQLKKSHIARRIQKLESGLGIDWATAEAIALGTLLYQGFNVRLSGQDVGRGTFSHRHVMLVCQHSDSAYIPLNFITPQQTNFLEVVNSPLSEEAVLGFEYGFSVESPQHLVLWEAQFGDFFNGAQLIIDTFVASGEAKWLLQSGLVLLLPHGYDGAGPDHSSCQVERFLLQTNSHEAVMDGDNVNMHIAHPTTPAQYYHLLRRQMVRNFRKPLIVMSPKILLRLPEATSSLHEMAPGTTFQPVLPDPGVDPLKVRRVVFCSGKHYYALDGHRRMKNITNTAIVRLELLCPFPSGSLHEQLVKFSNATEYVWSQEEPMNKGPWTFVQPRFVNQLGLKLELVSRPPYAASAVGVGKIHLQEANKLLTDTFATDY